MTTILTQPPRTTERRSLRQVDGRTRRRKLTSLAMRVVLTITMALACVPLVLSLYVVAERGWAVIDLRLFTQDTLPLRPEGGGFRPGVVGSSLTIGLD